jgi:hypothetical protein
MLALALSAVLAFLQAPTQTGTVTGVVKLPNGARPAEVAHVALLPPKYADMWNKQVQQRLDNYWEVFKPELLVNKEHVTEIYRMAHLEAFRYVTSTMRRELGDGSTKFTKDASATGQFEFRNIPFGTYQLLVETTAAGQNIVWSKTVDVDSDMPVFVDLGQPVS